MAKGKTKKKGKGKWIIAIVVIVIIVDAVSGGNRDNSEQSDIAQQTDSKKEIEKQIKEETQKETATEKTEEETQKETTEENEDSKVTMENFLKISANMTYEQVVEILGEGGQQSESEIDGSISQIYDWNGEGLLNRVTRTISIYVEL